MEYITETRQVPVQPFHDVIVVGGFKKLKAMGAKHFGIHALDRKSVV